MADALTWPNDGPPEGTKERALWRAGLVINLIGDEIEDDETRLGDVLIDLIQWSHEKGVDFDWSYRAATLDAMYEREQWQ